MPSNGLSTVLAPIHVKTMIVEISIQYLDFFVGVNLVLLFFFVTNTAITKIEDARATTPPNFEGIDRRITYANRKYHSGWMCTGATKGFAGLKFSTSPSMLGLFEDSKSITIVSIIIGRESFVDISG